MFARLCALTATVAVGVTAIFMAGPAWAANHSYPATYTGTVAVGGTVDFDVSADGLSVTRFKISDVPTTCGTVTSELTGNITISGDAFSYPMGSLMFSGSFSAVQQAQGTVQVKVFGFPSCTSSVMNWTATTTAPPPPPPSSGGPPSGGNPGLTPDTTAPALALSGTTTQKAGRTVALTVGCNEACTISATGTVSVPGAAKSYKLGGVTTHVAAGAKATLKLKVSSSAQKAIKKALKRHRKVVVKIAVKVRDAAGNSSTATRTIRLK